MKALVFGKTGQVARSLAPRLAGLEAVSFLDRSGADLSRPDTLGEVIEAAEPDVVINAAAYTAVDQAESEPELAHTVNAEAPEAMAEACARHGAWLIHYSTDYVFDGTASEPYAEDAGTAPINVYGRSKLAGEEAVRRVHDRHLIFRTSWVYSNHGRNFLNTMLRLAGERDELGIVVDQTGSPTWAGSIADATARVLDALAAGRVDDAAGTYHMTCGGQTSWYGFTCRIFELAGLADAVRVKAIATSEFPTPAARPMYSVLANDKLERVFGVKMDPWEVALRRCLSERDEDQQ
ncbi:MAG TPA: dTDP-4-dehydrorhamnose reductase [Arenicellales bacterium]|nr:dTDP-4-dehydrorhamnose reductase [Arenicellales bacterium]